MNHKILIIDAHPVYAKKMEGYLRGLTFQNVCVAVTGLEGMSVANQIIPDLVLLSGALPDVASADVCCAIKKISSKIRIIVQIGLFSSEEEIEKLQQFGADVVVDRKEKDMVPLEQAIEKLLLQKIS